MENIGVVLFGHSLCGYCVSAVLNYHPEVKAVIYDYNAEEKGDFDISAFFEAYGLGVGGGQR